MDNTVLVAPGSALLGVILSAIITYVIQKKVVERQRKWAIEDESRHIEQKKDEEIRKLIIDISVKRTGTIEESAGLMYQYIYYRHGIALNMPLVFDKEGMNKNKLRIQEINGEAWNSVETIGSNTLRECYNSLSNTYWDLAESGVLKENQAEAASQLFKTIISQLDIIRTHPSVSPA